MFKMLIDLATELNRVSPNDANLMTDGVHEELVTARKHIAHTLANVLLRPGEPESIRVQGVPISETEHEEPRPGMVATAPPTLKINHPPNKKNKENP